jgi:hypothetical protein
MLTESQLILITAAVDGDLTDAEARDLRRLLDESALARTTYDRLRADSLRLQSLPRIEPPADLQERVMARIAALGPIPAATPARPIETPSHPARRPWHRVAPIAIAASVLIAIAGTSFLIFSADRGDSARDSNRPPAGGRDNGNDPPREDWLPGRTARLPSAPMPSERVEGADVHQAPAPAVAPDNAVAIAPEPRTPDHDLIGAHPRAEFPNFDLVQLRLPFLEPLADFEREAIRQQLTEELGRDPAFRIDLFARSPIRGAELILKAARASGLAVHADTASMNYLRKGQVSSVVLYTDSLSAPQLTALLAVLNSEDAKVSPRVFDAVHAMPIAREDEIEIRRVLGADPGLFKRALPDRRKDAPKGESVSAGTADQIASAIRAGKGGGGSGVLMTWAPAQGRTPPSASVELKTYLSKRGERKPDAVPVIIVIRHGNG